MWAHPCLLPLAALLLLAAVGCTGPEGGDADAAAGSDAAGDAGTADVPSDADRVDEEGEPVAEGGPLTFVAASLSVLAERVCDVDGDGLLDNAVAALGSPSAQLFVGAVNSAIQGQIEGDDERPVMHFPWLEDQARPSDADAVLLVFGGRDTDVPRDPSDDYSGFEPFYIDDNHLDGCGEPRRALLHVEIASGEVSGGEGATPSVFGSGLALRGGQASGTIKPRGAGAEVDLCGYLVASELGPVHQSFSGEELSVLEVLLSGGASFGLPTIPGLTPDVDLDGDGLERFILGEDGHLSSCVDGDSTEIEGVDCWADERIADAFSMTTRFEGVPARFAGREPGWDEGGSETCEGGPPEHSLLDP